MPGTPKRKLFAEAVSGYVQERLEELHQAGEELSKLSVSADLGKSDCTQVRLGKLGIGEARLGRYAKLLGFASEDDLRVAAYQWWLSRRETGAGLTLAMRTARDEIAKLHRATPAELDAIFAAYAHERFRGRDVDWWIATLSAELREERRRRRLAAVAGEKRSVIGGSR